MLPTVSASFLSSLCVFCVRGVWVTSILFFPFLFVFFFAQTGDCNKLWPKPGEKLLHPPPSPPSPPPFTTTRLTCRGNNSVFSTRPVSLHLVERAKPESCCCNSSFWHALGCLNKHLRLKKKKKEGCSCSSSVLLCAAST